MTTKMNLLQQLAFCNEQRQTLENIRTTTDALLSEDPTTLVITREPGQFVRFVNGQVTPDSLLLLDGGVQDIADDPEQLGIVAQGLNKHFLEDAIRESRQCLDLVTAVSASLRHKRGEIIRKDETGLPDAYDFELMTYRQAEQRASDKHALIGSVVFTGLEHEQEATVWTIGTGIGPELANFEMIYLRAQPVIARWALPGPALSNPIEPNKELLHYIGPVLSGVYLDEQHLQQQLQNIYIESIGTADEEKMGSLLPSLRAFLTQRRQRMNTRLEDNDTPTLPQLRLLADHLATLHNA